MIKTGAENVSPVEVAELLVPFVVPATGRHPDPADLTEFRRAGLSPFKVPRLWRVVDDLPMTASAKVQRAELRRVAADSSA
jgi:fatty-acyl-CoA synthase